MAGVVAMAAATLDLTWGGREYPLMVLAVDLQNQFNLPHGGKGGRTANAAAGKLRPLLGRQLVRQVAMGGARYGLDLIHNPGNVIGWVTEAQAAADMTLLDNLSVANHVQIKNDLRWRRLYRCAQRNINFMNPVGVVVAQWHQTYPCHYCGVILPEEFIEVDHRQPQRHPGVAVLKVIRAVNAAYTTAAATGTKAGQVANINAAPSVGPFPLSLAQTMALAALNPIPVNGWDWVTAWQGNAGAMNVNKTARYTITAAGQTFLSLCSMLWGLAGSERRCLNNLLNLVPACRACNGAGGKGSMTHAHQ